MADARGQLLAVLHEAASQDFTRIKRAEEQLKQWENEPRFFATLQDIFYDPSIHHDVRFLSGIYLKNGVNRFWRKTAKNPIGQDEKAQIRQRLLQFLNEPSKKLTAQNAIIVSRIARMDYPAEWPDLLPSLIQAIESTNAYDPNQSRIIHERAFEMLYEVLYELSTRLLSSGRRQFAEIAPRVFQTAANAYLTYTTQTLSALSGVSQEQLPVELGIVTSCVKCLRILMVSGIRDVHKYDETKTFLTLSKEHLEKYMNAHSSASTLPPALKTGIDEIIEEHGTMYIALQKAHPISCILCPAWVSILNYYWQHIFAEGHLLLERYKTDQHKQLPIFEQFLLQGMILVKDTIKNSTHSNDSLSVTEEEKAMTTEAQRIIHSQFLTTEFVNLCAETLVSRYMVLSPSDFEKWEEDPENWVNASDDENWEFELRPCAEMTFVSLLTQYRDQLCPILLGLVENVAVVNDYAGLLFKDAVYAAIGLGVQSLYGRFDFEPFVANRLLQEIGQKESSFKILRRRIAWMLGKWVNEGISADCRVSIYQGLLQLMVAEEDLVVRITAAHSLRLAIDDWDFDISILLPYLGPAMNLLLSLLNEVEDSDTAMKLIRDLNAVMDRCGSHMVPYGPKIIELLMPLWHNSQAEPLFQSAQVVTFTKLTSILSEESLNMQTLFLPVVEYCINPANKVHVYLLEDALDLWWTLIQTTPSSTSNMMALLPLAVQLLDNDTESLRKVLKLIESYILLDAQSSLQQCSLPLFSCLETYIGSYKTEVASTIANTIDTALQSCPIQVYGDSLVQSGLLTAILNVFLQNQLPAYNIMSYMSPFARLAIGDAPFLLNFINLAGQQANAPQNDFLAEVLDRWLDKFDNIGQTRARKLHCMAFAALLQTNHPTVLVRLPNIMGIWTGVLDEIQNTEEDVYLYSEADMHGDLAELDESAEKIRKSEFRHNDPVYKTDLKEMIKQVLAECERNCGGAQPFQQLYLSKVDPSLLEIANKLLSS